MNHFVANLVQGKTQTLQFDSSLNDFKVAGLRESQNLCSRSVVELH